MPKPVKATKGGGRLLRMNMSHYIPLPLDSLMHALLKEIPDEKDKLRFIDFARRLHHLYRSRITNQSWRLRKGFQLFANNVTVDLGFTEEIVEAEEDSFIDNFHRTMMEANFELLSQDTYQDALNSEYTLNLDLELDTNALDSSFLKRFFLHHEDELGDAADVTRHVLVYHRGYGLDKTKGLFIIEKVDVLFRNMFHVLWRGLQLLLLFLSVWKWPAILRGDMEDDDAETEASLAAQTADTMPFDPSLSVTEHSVAQSRQVILRKSLEGLIAAAPFSTLFSVTQLQEPTFKEMVVLYRTAEQRDEAAQRPGIPPSISVKSFKNIPVADFEIVLPCQRPTTRALDLVKVLAAVLVALATVATKFWQFYEEEKEENDWHTSTWQERFSEIAPLLIIVGTYASKILVQIRTQQATYQNLMTNYLYQRTTDSDDGVRAHLEDSTILQEVKESLLAFFFLWRCTPSGPVTLEDLDMHVEQFLLTIDNNVDFEVDDAVQKLVADGIVNINTEELEPESQLKNLSISRAITKLEQQWQVFFSNPNQECPYCPFLKHDDL
ncbi:hypothetical protein PTSG_03740 [Salpingoeca rosetta]|uniref:Uncharacterized protein n=1 Tax=Salpingoeca rosetta (strain ATCC 50818 / BSB-021) TaxID=946362 RepID=F2U6F9_SALR5|nr:uncharacterized protein PTSG_03740 [Salpingoeca rosetta]EGD83100.1 hypothetical protein PTSG_03740 [Salpingoeca rosetta]|eukprot:XP_004995464.1 hypothetical protein PTSG_03740 [Salpingoeca rosetta]